tara:strand:+ start:1520 stop:2149 length:630 start_codon:yes stop_codon:yes gene_type:complete
MSLINAGFRFPFCLSLTSLFSLILLTACQPLIQAQTGAQTKVPVISPSEDKATSPAEQNQPIAPLSNALTAEDIAATPLHTDASSGEQPVNKAVTREPGKPNVEVTQPLEPEKPYVKPTFNPADLVGRSPSYVGAQFGKADFNRTEGVIHVLQYRQADCVIDLFIKIAGTAGARPPENAKILGWTMRERTINKPLDQTLCQQQFYDRKL